MAYLLQGLIVAILLTIVAINLPAQRNRRNLPPGPPRLPVIGNLHQAPTDYPWRTYQQWSKQYGPVFSLQYGLNTIIMLGTHKAARDLLDKRSNIYSSRPHVPMGGDIVSKGLRNVLMPYGNQWRAHQRVQASYLNFQMSQSYREIQDVESKQLIYEILSTSEFSDRFHRYSSSTIFALNYGQRMVRGDEPEVKAVDQTAKNFICAARVGTWIVDAIPALNYLPAFLAPWKRYGNKLYKFDAENYSSFFESGLNTKSWNFTKQVGQIKESQNMSHLEKAYDVGVIYEAGTDTTTIALEIFVMAAVLHPDVVKNAQAELDSIVGTTRMPTFDDQSQLPYINAIVKEVLRWRPVSAGGIPHAVTQDDSYMGYTIPKGATVIGNHWSLHLDEDVYEDAYAFNPTRWIDHPDLPLTPFGFGRRVCTGQHIAKNSLFINIARLLWAFDIGYAWEVEGGVKRRCEVDSLAFTQGFNSRPLPFKASFRVRGDGYEQVVKREWEGAEKDVDVLLGRVRDAQMRKG